MPVDYRKKIAFCHVPRTGGYVICEGLKLRVIDKHYPASWYRANFPDFFLFATFRPDIDRINSSKGWKPTKEMLEKDPNINFNEYINDLLVQGIRKMNDLNPGEIVEDSNTLLQLPNKYFLDVPVDCLLQYNNLNKDLNKMLESLGHDPVELTFQNSWRTPN